MNYVNPFTDGISLKRGCGVPCSHLRCEMSSCERARVMANGELNFVMNIKSQVLYLIHVGRSVEAIELLTALRDSGHINSHRFESFRAQHFSSQL